MSGRRGRTLAHALQRRLSMTEFNTSNGDGEMSPGPRARRASLVGEPSDMELLAQRQEEALLPLKEDVADWLNKTLGIDINVDNFMEVLDSGVHMCQLAQLIQEREKEMPAEETVTQRRPRSGIKFRSNAKSGTWFARDNTANFLQWCRNYGVKEECLFETEGLVCHREPRTVILCLLELARLGSKFGIEPPNLVALEREIETEEVETERRDAISPSLSGKVNNHDEQRDTVAPTLPVKNGDTVTPQSTPSKNRTVSPRSRNGSGDSGTTRPGSAGKTRRKSVSTNKSTSSSKPDDLDKAVRQISGTCQCPDCYKVDRLDQGKYNIGGKTVFIRLLKGKHLMVRVGGGWDTLEHYLATHDPCRILEFKRNNGAHILDGVQDNQFLFIRGKYKSSS